MFLHNDKIKTVFTAEMRFQSNLDVIWIESNIHVPVLLNLSVTPNINWTISTKPNKCFLSHGMLPLSGHDDVALFEWRRLWRWINTKIKKLRHNR